jgi:hypothetical protein
MLAHVLPLLPAAALPDYHPECAKP